MFLCHFTELSNLASILKDKQLKANAITHKANQGQGIYTKPNPYVYFTFCRQLFNSFDVYEPHNKKHKYAFPSVILYFSPTILENRDFFLSSVLSPEPENVGTFIDNRGLKQKKIAYKKGTKQIERKLDNFYFFNNNVFLEGQIAVKNRVKLFPFLVAIEFKNCQPPLSLMKLIEKPFADILIKFSNTSHSQEMREIAKEKQFVSHSLSLDLSENKSQK